MNSKEKDIIALCLGVMFSFGLAVVSDWFLGKYRLSDASKIVNNRGITDASLRVQAREQGFVTILAPSKTDNSPFTSRLIAGIPYIPTYYCNEGYGLITYESDRFGFRNSDNLWDSRVETLFIGDSFVHGACVDDSSTLPSRYGVYSGESTLNLGYGGNNPLHYDVYARLFVPKLRPKNVFLTFYVNDFGTFEKPDMGKHLIAGGAEFFHPELVKPLNEDEFKKEGLALLEQLMSKPKVSIFNRAAGAFVRHMSLPTIRRTLFPQRDTLEQKLAFVTAAEQSLRTIKSLCVELNCRVTIVFIPNSAFFQPRSSADFYGDWLVNFARESKLNFLDGRLLVDRSRDSPDFAPEGGHLSPEGYDKIAQELSKMVASEHGSGGVVSALTMSMHLHPWDLALLSP